MANFPSSVSTNSNLYIAVNGIQTTLAASILATDTTIQLTSVSGFPTTGYVTIDNSEVVLYTGISGSNLTGCLRGADGTTAAPHNLGVTVGATIVAAHHNLLKDEVIAIETALGAGFSLPLSVLNGGTGVTTKTGTGSVVLSNSPTLVTPALGTPSAAVLTNATGLPLTTGVTGTLPDSNTTATPNATPSTIVERDANANTKVNTVIENFATTVTAAGTTALTAATAPLQQLTGTTTQTVTLPDATTLSVGFQITVLNRSTGAITVNNFGGLLQQTVPATAQTTFTCTNVGSSNGTWDVSTSSAAGITAYREDYVVGTALNNYTGSTTVFNLVTPYSVGGHSMVVILDGDVQTIGATVDYQETNSTTVTFNNALVTGQRVSFVFQTATSSGGTVNSGTSGQLAYYPSTGPTISSTPAASVGASGNLVGTGLTDGSVVAAGKIGERISSAVTVFVNTPSDTTFGDLTSILLSAGEWELDLLVRFERGTATWTQVIAAFGTASGSSNAGVLDGDSATVEGFSSSSTTPTSKGLAIANYRVSCTAPTTIYLKVRASYSAGQPSMGGRITALRTA